MEDLQFQNYVEPCVNWMHFLAQFYPAFYTGKLNCQYKRIIIVKIVYLGATYNLCLFMEADAASAFIRPPPPSPKADGNWRLLAASPRSPPSSHTNLGNF